ncbi:MAG: C45 family autoproteolytic acyltransferase/hydrolase [Micromonosporaceae bacterium]
MIRRFTSTVAGPAERGEEFGSRHASEVARTVEDYRRFFDTRGAVDLHRLGTRTLEQVEAFAPELALEIRGIASGARLPTSHVAAVNARTEVLAVLDRAGAGPGPGECSAVVCLGDVDAEPVAVQTWDWYADMAENWFEWTIPFPDGRRVVTLTEYGIVGKIGVNDSGVGLLFTMLHHQDDGAGVGVPVHVVARRILDTAGSVSAALDIAAAARTSASTSLTLVGARRAGKDAITAELWPGGPGHVRPNPEGLLVHTNHFLSEPARDGDLSPDSSSDTLARYEALRQGLQPYRGRATLEQILTVMNDHTAGVCCHPDPLAGPEPLHATLATISLDLAAGRATTWAGGPCRIAPVLAPA